jgi:hydrogenase maturation protein HypF
MDISAPPRSPSLTARYLLLTGQVQGVGFRPHVYRLAMAHGLSGWVRNRTGDVEVLVQGDAESLDRFEATLIADAPPLARAQLLRREPRPAQALTGFRIRDSAESPGQAPHLPPDGFVCDDCLRELRDPRDRRYRYPFINCTQCGPRYTLIEHLPYDRANTAMRPFVLCPDCRTEYENPGNRRFHAEPLACPACGPQLQFASESDGLCDDTQRALAMTVAALRRGEIVAVKGIGGYHLLCDARNDTALARLRAVKPRPHKPLAVMFPWTGPEGLGAVRAQVEIEDSMVPLLTGAMRPIVLARRRSDATLPASLAPGLKEIGVFLPYSPLHHLLLSDLDTPLVATSANLGGEPVLTDNVAAETRLAHIADAFLHHDRPIARPADDAVYRVIAGRPRPLRNGRGLAPLELELPDDLPEPLLAVGGHMKNTIALGFGRRAILSPHIGDLDNPRALAVFTQVIGDLQQLYGVHATRAVCDAHPAYTSTRWARQSGLPVTAVLHHHAHAAALAGEHPDTERWLSFTWDGVGYGADGTLWGGEALLGRPGSWKRVASFRPFRLPGGDRAAREPWRAALALCWEAGIEWRGGMQDSALLRAAWNNRQNSPPTSAVGRLFDAAAAITGVNDVSSYEGQGPMLLEAACAASADAIELPVSEDAQEIWRSDWAPLLPMLLDESRPVAGRAACLHASLAQALVAQACLARARYGNFTVGLSGGVFQNRRLTELAVARLQEAGFAVCLPVQVPCNDAGLAFGQLVETCTAATHSIPDHR